MDRPERPHSISRACVVPAAPRLRHEVYESFRHLSGQTTTGFIDQAEQYAKALTAHEGRPPFLIVVDVGYSIELFADFSGAGKAYVPFPDSLTHRILLAQLESPMVCHRLRAIWLDPLSLDPSRISASVTQDVAWHLANPPRSASPR